MHAPPHNVPEDATQNASQTNSHARMSPQLRSNHVDQLPVEVTNVIMWNILDRRKFGLNGSTFSSEVINALNFVQAYPTSMPYFASCCYSFSIGKNCINDNDGTVASCFAPYLQHLTIDSHPKLNSVLDKMWHSAPTLRSISIEFEIKEYENVLDTLLRNLSLLMLLSVETLREFNLCICSDFDDENLLRALVQQALAPFVSNVTKISLSGTFALKKLGLLSLLANAGSNLRHLSLHGLSPDFNQFEVFSIIRHACPGITELRIDDFDSVLWNDIAQFILSFGPTLRSLSCTKYDENAWTMNSALIVSECTQLRSVETMFYQENFEFVILPLAEISENLRCISLVTEHPVYANDFKRFGGLFPQLREFLWETTGDDQTDAFCELCKQIGSQLHVLEYSGSATDAVLRATMHCTSLRALFLGRTGTVYSKKNEMSASNTEAMESMLSITGPSLRLFSLRGLDCDPVGAFCDINLEKVEFDGEGLASSLIKHCVKLKALQLLQISHRFSSMKSYHNALNRLRLKFTRLLLYADTPMPSGFVRDWTCSPHEGTAIDIYE